MEESYWGGAHSSWIGKPQKQKTKNNSNNNQNNKSRNSPRPTELEGSFNTVFIGYHNMSLN
jgi:hypothetical protein